MLEWVIDNKEWIFSGFGVSVIMYLFVYLGKKTPKEDTHNNLNSSITTENSGSFNNSTTINASGNSKVVIGTRKDHETPTKDSIGQERYNPITIEGQKAQTYILFIDNEGFPIVNIIKNTGWKNCSLIKKISDLNIDKVQRSHIIFVDIRGVGEELFGKDAGLGVAKALEEKYPEKIIILYSAENNWNIFHEAINMVDDKIEKNAKPIEFISLIETYAAKVWKKG